jgi:membrane fusion protein (multidrug efflux system)
MAPSLSRFASLATMSVLLAACGGDPEPPPMPTPEVTVVTLAAQPLAVTRELPGRVHPFLVAEVRPQVTGLVARQLFTEGAKVEAGAPLYQLDDASYRADLSSAKAALARVEATRKTAALSAERSAKLAEIDAISAQENESATAALRQAEAEVGVARAAVDNANITLGYARITAPITGRIGKSSVTQGALVTANQATALATIQQLDPVYVDLSQSSSELLQLRREFAAGTLERSDDVPVSIVLEDGTAYSHTGQLAFSDVSVNPETGSYLLRVVVPNPERLLLPGMYVRAVVANGERSDGVLVPQEAVTRNAKGEATVMVVGAEDTIEARVIEVSRSQGGDWIVDAGLAAGDRVVVEGLQKIQPGAKVKATERSDVAATEAVAPPPIPAPGGAR